MVPIECQLIGNLLDSNIVDKHAIYIYNKTDKTVINIGPTVTILSLLTSKLILSNFNNEYNLHRHYATIYFQY